MNLDGIAVVDKEKIINNFQDRKSRLDKLKKAASKAQTQLISDLNSEVNDQPLSTHSRYASGVMRFDQYEQLKRDSTVVNDIIVSSNRIITQDSIKTENQDINLLASKPDITSVHPTAHLLQQNYEPGGT